MGRYRIILRIKARFTGTNAVCRRRRTGRGEPLTRLPLLLARGLPSAVFVALMISGRACDCPCNPSD